ncbi:MAG: hypothetical protein IPJ76_00385 [Flavobacteriales bacterium]|nr:MAG: hypothetical protein IPJ76_00385 [Flavobacteriales bacterium]
MKQAAETPMTELQKGKVKRFAEDMVLTIDSMGYRQRRTELDEIRSLIVKGGFEGAYRRILELSTVKPLLLSDRHYELFVKGYRRLASKYEKLLDAHSHQRIEFVKVFRTSFVDALALLDREGSR